MSLKLMGALLGPFFLFVACNSGKAPDVPSPGPSTPGKEARAMTEAPSEVPVQPAAAVEVKADQVEPSDEASLARGKKVYMSVCIQCHNKDPNKKGPIGPEMIDAPIEVMTSKVMTSNYPNPLPHGFVPKRKSHAMKAFPKLKADIPYIHAWVQSVKKKK